MKTYHYKFCDSEGVCIEDKITIDYQYYESDKQSGAYIMNLKSKSKYPLAKWIRYSIFPGKYVTVIKVCDHFHL